MKVLQVLEATTNMTEINRDDFKQIKKFFSYLENERGNYNFTLDDIMRFVLTIKSKKSALRNVAGSGEEVFRSLVSSRNSRETNIARAFSDEKDIKLGEVSQDKMYAIGSALQAAGYASIDQENPNASFINRDATARLLKFINVVKSNGFRTSAQVNQNFQQAVSVYQQNVKEFGADIIQSTNDRDVAAQQVAEITPNMLIFIASVVKKKGRSEAWDTYLNPNNYIEPPLQEYVPISYNPQQAASQLISMGFTKKTPVKGLITLNREAIKRSVSALRNELEELKKGSIEHPSNASTSTLRPAENNAKALIEKINSMVSNDIKRMAESKLVSALQKASETTGDDSFIRAYKLYTNKLDQAFKDEAVGDAANRVKKTHLGQIIAFLRAKIIARMLYYYATMIIGDKKKWKEPNKDYGFLGLKELSMVRSAMKNGDALKRSRIA